MIEAIFVDAFANEAALAWARAAHAALVQRVANGDASRLPLLRYDPYDTVGQPFRLWDPRDSGFARLE